MTGMAGDVTGLSVGGRDGDNWRGFQGWHGICFVLGVSGQFRLEKMKQIGVAPMNTRNNPNSKNAIEAYKYLLDLLADGAEFPDATAKACAKYNVSCDMLRDKYDMEYCD